VALIPSPATGTYVDPATGSVYHDPAGTIPATDPGLTQQAQRSLGISNNLLQSLGQYGQGFQQAQAGQQQLGSYLNRVINGSAPSVAQQQLTAGLDQTKAGIESAASGATGNNAGFAQYAKLQALGGADAATNQAAALQRQQEVNAAVGAKGALLGSQAAENANMYGTTLSGAAQFGGQAVAPAQTQADVDQKNKQAWMNFIGNLANAAGGAAAGYFSGQKGQAPAAAAAG